MLGMIEKYKEIIIAGENKPMRGEWQEMRPKK